VNRILWLSFVPLLWCSSASADPILTLPDNGAIVWTGTAGVANWADIHEPIVWTSTLHLRFACFEQLGPDGLPTTDSARASNCVRQTIRDGVFIYSMDVAGIQCGDRAQGDTELDAGSDVGVWLVVNRQCDEVMPPPRIVEPRPVPEPTSFALLALGCLLLAKVARV
jgi:hypothetical protein